MVLVLLIAGFQKGQFGVMNETCFLILCFFGAQNPAKQKIAMNSSQLAQFFSQV